MLTIAILCRRRMNITREKTSLRVGVVGTGGSGKLSLVQRYVTGEWPEPVEKEEKKLNELLVRTCACACACARVAIRGR